MKRAVALNPDTNRTARTHPPRATYRVQFHRGFAFDDAANIAGYLLDVPDGRWRNELTGDVVSGGSVKLGDLLRRFPVALLAKEELAR